MSNLVKINDVDLAPIEYRGARVMTLAMMDAAHKRPDGTARRNFNENKARLIEGEDFHEVTADEIRTQSLGNAFAARTSKGTLLTETGYSMLVKSFTDDLAWDVQRQLVKSYFRAQPAPAARPARRKAPSMLDEARVIDYIGNMVAKVPGARADVVATIKLRLVQERTGVPAIQFREALPAEPINKAVKLNPTEIGKRLTPAVRPADVNKILIRLGLQRKSESGHVLTDAGTAHGESRPFQAKNKHVGDQIAWYESVVQLVANEINRPPPSAQGVLAV